MAEQQEMFEYSPPPEQAQFSNNRPTDPAIDGEVPIKIELDEKESYQIGDQVLSGEELINGKVHGNVGIDDPRWNDVVGLREEVARLQGQLASVQQGNPDGSQAVVEDNVPPQINRVADVFSKALEEGRNIDHEYLVDLFSAFAADRDDEIHRYRESPENVNFNKALFERELTSLGEQQLVQQSKQEAANNVFKEFVGNKASRSGMSEESVIEDYQVIADEVMSDPSLLTMQTPEEAGAFMHKRLQTVASIVDKKSGGHGTVQRTTQQNQAQLNSGNGKVYTPKRSTNGFKMPVYPSQDQAKYNFDQTIKQADRVIG